MRTPTGDDGTTASARDRELVRLLVTETRDEMVKADQKAGLLLSALGAVMVAVLSVTIGDASPRTYGGAAQALFWTGCAAWVPSLVLLGAAVAPRVGFPRTGRAHYFGDIALAPSVPRLSAIVRGTDPLERDLSQLAELSRLVTAKYRCIRHGMLCSTLFFVLTPLGVMAGTLR